MTLASPRMFGVLRRRAAGARHVGRSPSATPTRALPAPSSRRVLQR